MPQLEKTYDPKKYEADIYRRWEEAKAFQPTGDGEPFCIIMPPPNANGELHWGHAIGYTTEDIVTRYKRMRGYKTLWLPGTDHAGIETQFVYERDVLGPQGKSRFDLGPEKFYAEVMAWTQDKQQNILKRFKGMGFSADWTKLKFTLDKNIIDTVYETFIKLYEDGYVYRGNRLVNWCVSCQAAFADIEIVHQERQHTLYTLDYGTLKIATTRPETIFADVAVAVNPEDKRHQALVGKEATIPIANRKIPIIADEHVDPKTGTGALKVTPGHDRDDYEIGQRHKLVEISVIDTEGKLINVPEDFAGLSVVEARERVVDALRKANKLSNEQAITHAVGLHDRCGTIIEPLISEQWFLRIKKLNAPVMQAIENEDVKFFPSRYKKIALDWLAQEHDWCISRQIWWGIRIPVYYKTSNDPDKKAYIVAKTEDEAEKYYGAGNYRAEPDTFDTWFSSGQWPYATLMSTGDFEAFYPTSLMGTAREILHKWVTRMIMFGLYRTGKVPFREVYLWGLVTDEHGAKMSKSKGNVIDPVVITDKYGTDALRLAGAISNAPGNDSPMSESRVAAMRNFNNKLWNVARFVLAKLDGKTAANKFEPRNLVDEWWLDRLSKATAEISTKIENYRLNEAANLVYHLLWDDLADWYLEAVKGEENLPLLTYSLETVLKLAHPFIPYVTEAIWAQIPGHEGLLITTPWPTPDKNYPEAAAEFEQIKKLTREIRAIRKELDLPAVPLYYRKSSSLAKAAIIIQKLAGVSEVTQVATGEGLPILSLVDGWLGVDHETIKIYQTNLETKRSLTEAYVKKLSQQLANAGFSSSAPKDVVNQAKQRLKEAKGRLEFLDEQIAKLANL